MNVITAAVVAGPGHAPRGRNSLSPTNYGTHWPGCPQETVVSVSAYSKFG